jgi:branched-subunit amino acid aminotransferase/4-amino-4-deoxychorismate lyase
MSDLRAVEINGQPASADAHTVIGWGNYGHFTSMQVRDGRTRGLDLHLARLDAANRELFGVGLDAELVRDRIRQALGEVRDATVRVRAYAGGDGDAEPDRTDLMVIVDKPVDMPARPHRLGSIAYQRPVPHIKHSGGFAQGFYRRQVAADGFDEGLLIDGSGVISEGTSTNVGWSDGSTVIWPDAPSLAGTTMQLLQRELAARGITQTHQVVRVTDLPSLPSMFLANSWGIAPVNRVDDMDLPVDAAAMKALADAYDNAHWDDL